MAIKHWRGQGSIEKELAGVRDFRLRPCGINGPLAKMQLFDATGSCVATLWSSADGASYVEDAAQSDLPLVRVSGRFQTGKWSNELLIESAWPASDKDILSNDDFVLQLPATHADDVRRLDALLAGVRDRFFSELLTQILSEQGRYREQYIKAWAAKANHHAYAGGLLRHSVEVAEMARRLASVESRLNTDLLITGGLLHDIGKLWELRHDIWRGGEYTQQGHLHGHIHLGSRFVESLCRRLNVPTAARDSLVHIILSHHGECALGSPKPPMTPEAVIISHCDAMSATLAKFYELQNAQESETAVAYRNNVPFYVAPLLWQEAANPLPTFAGNTDPEERLLLRLSGRETVDPVPASLPFMVAYPIVGVVAAGDGVRSAPGGGEMETCELLPPAGGADFLLRVTGDSMICAGIEPGDLLLVRRQETAKVRDIVIALVPESGPVVKRLMESGGVRFLRSENTAYAPITVTAETRIQGIVVDIVKKGATM